MSMPVIDDENRKKPLCYDPSRSKFIYYDEIIARAEPIVFPSTLSQSDRKKLVLERQVAGPDYSTQTISGSRITRNDMVQMIQNDEGMGKTTVEAEISYLNELLAEIKRNLK
ncbi:MAG: hypothetical protein JXA73_16430 [Acidobacteria bacterium]|nr:hypothetical protein [Acidobacteriota bacterium]